MSSTVRGRGWSVDARMSMFQCFQHVAVGMGLFGLLNWWTRGSLSGEIPAGQVRDITTYSAPKHYSNPMSRGGFAGGDGPSSSSSGGPNGSNPFEEAPSLFTQLLEANKMPPPPSSGK